MAENEIKVCTNWFGTARTSVDSLLQKWSDAGINPEDASTISKGKSTDSIKQLYAVLPSVTTSMRDLLENTKVFIEKSNQAYQTADRSAAELK